MAISVTISKANVVNGQVQIEFSDGSGASWPSVADFVAEQDQMIFQDPDLLKRIALALIAVRAPNLTNPGLIVGKTLTFNPDIANVMRVT